jgi:hypothetical protein
MQHRNASGRQAGQKPCNQLFAAHGRDVLEDNDRMNKIIAIILRKLREAMRKSDISGFAPCRRDEACDYATPLRTVHIQPTGLSHACETGAGESTETARIPARFGLKYRLLDIG